MRAITSPFQNPLINRHIPDREPDRYVYIFEVSDTGIGIFLCKVNCARFLEHGAGDGGCNR